MIVIPNDDDATAIHTPLVPSLNFRVFSILTYDLLILGLAFGSIHYLASLEFVLWLIRLNYTGKIILIVCLSNFSPIIIINVVTPLRC
jgi:hypothetical protein